ncbi:phosphoribosylformylglycinamidine synthase, partial [bacterium]|nr:phosphoribosylformylglycinamidine synthase [bacterium]
LGLPQEPTDVELECLAQTWSEHCFHKVFQSRIHYTDHEGNSEKIDSLFATYIKGATEKIDADFVVSAFHDNAGIVRLHETFDLAYKIETHNSPSALDPYGGAMTGIVGVDRDILGAGLGCEPLAHVKGFCLGDPSLEGSLPGGLLHPQRVRDGVHLGVQEGGNQSGIPLLRGFEIFEPRYSGKPLVFCGTLGKIPRSVQGRDSFEKKINPGDYIVVVGGRVGKDGIHGATFSSLELTHDSPVQAVQIGDPITQKRVTDMLREARDQGMYRCITDNGAGGLSSSVGEMAKLTGGARIDLNQVPLKYPGLHPWEIFVSESQERMTLAIESQSLESFLHLCLNRGVEASCLGTFTDSGSLEIYFADLCVACLDMKFLHEGHPGLVLKGSFEMRSYPVPDLSQISPEEALLKLVGSLNLCSKETKLRQYDWEVKGLSAVKLLVGEKQDVIPDASVIQVDHDVLSGIALSESIHPTLSDLDPYAMAVLVVDEAVRKVIATGANLGEIAGVDNFCWPSVVNESLPDRSQKLGQLVRACQGLRDACVTLKVPLISGKDSMANDCTRVDPPISIPPTLLFSVMARIEDVSKCVTLDWKSASDSVFLVGQTKDELGASELYRTLGQRIEERPAIGISFPSVCLETNLSTYQAMQKAISAGVVRSCHALERGGLAMGVARACLASGLGLEIELAQVAAHSNLDSPWPLIFSESGGRFLVSVAPENLDQFHEFMKDSHVFELGTVREEPQLSISYCSEKVIHLAIDKLRAEFHKPLEEKR